jgi:hypothetical protein
MQRVADPYEAAAHFIIVEAQMRTGNFLFPMFDRTDTVDLLIQPIEGERLIGLYGVGSNRIGEPGTLVLRTVRDESKASLWRILDNGRLVSLSSRELDILKEGLADGAFNAAMRVLASIRRDRWGTFSKVRSVPYRLVLLEALLADPKNRALVTSVLFGAAIGLEPLPVEMWDAGPEPA